MTSPASGVVDGSAKIEGDNIVIRVATNNLPAIVEGLWVMGVMATRFKVTDAKQFAKELLRALNDEWEDGTNPFRRMFDKAIEEAIEQGAEGIEEHEDQEHA